MPQNEQLLTLVIPIMKTLCSLFQERVQNAYGVDISEGEIVWFTRAAPMSHAERSSWVVKDEKAFQVSNRQEIADLIDALYRIVRYPIHVSKGFHQIDWFSSGLPEPKLPGDIPEEITIQLVRKKSENN